MQNFTRQYFLLILLLLSFSCKKSPKEVIKVDQETKDFTVFQEGTWWVYKNLKTNAIDTWKVISLKEFISEDEKTATGTYQELAMVVEFTSGLTLDFNVFGDQMIFNDKGFLSEYQMGYFTSGNVHSSRPACSISNIVLIQDERTNGVSERKEFIIQPMPCSPRYPSYCLWEKHIGIVKLAYPTYDTLVLIDKNIIQ